MFLVGSIKLEALLGFKAEFKGDISIKGTFRIDGRFIGNISAGSVILGEKAFVKGNISANSLIVGGVVEGTVKTDEFVEIKHTGQLYGDIFAKKLSVTLGGVLDGHANIQQNEAMFIAFPGAEAALK